MATIPSQLAASAYSAASKIGAGAGSGGANPAAALGNTAGTAAGAEAPSFGDLVSHALKDARNTQYKAESISVGAVANQAQIHDLVTAVSNAELTLQTVVSVRDKMINAYQDILKMPI
jgi:flagellar hook-basal body complex protein FliE